MRQALEAAQRARAERQDGQPDGPLTDAERARRHRARLRGEHVPERKPGPASREDRLRAALIETQAENGRLRERVSELEAELERMRRRRR
jgi:hypothetical protein